MPSLVVLAPNWLGDAVMALPAIQDVRRQRPGARIEVVARPAVAPLFTMVPAVDRALTLVPERGWVGRTAARAAVAILRDGGYDEALLLPNSFASAWATARAGIPERWGYAGDLRSPLLTRAIPRPDPPGHQGAYYQHLTTSLGFPAGPMHPTLRVSDEHLRAADQLLDTDRQVVVLAPGAAYGRAKQWIPDHFATLAGLLLRDGLRPVLVGSRADEPVCAAIAEDATRRAGSAIVLNLAGRTDLPTLAAVLSRARACVSNDSGAMHLAAAVGTEVVAIFGPTDETRTSPLTALDGTAAARVLTTDVHCRPCMLRECPIDHRCMTRISPHTVKATLDVLA